LEINWPQVLSLHARYELLFVCQKQLFLFFVKKLSRTQLIALILEVEQKGKNALKFILELIGPFFLGLLE
jgi:hypothetical protein